jgi:hypothetical protein
MARIGLRIQFVHGAAEMRAPLGDRDGEEDVEHQRAGRDEREPDVVMRDR